MGCLNPPWLIPLNPSMNLNTFTALHDWALWKLSIFLTAMERHTNENWLADIDWFLLFSHLWSYFQKKTKKHSKHENPVIFQTIKDLSVHVVTTVLFSSWQYIVFCSQRFIRPLTNLELPHSKANTGLSYFFSRAEEYTAARFLTCSTENNCKTHIHKTARL